MATEALYIPEEHLGKAIRILRAGIKAEKPPKEVAGPLLKWCREEEEYLKENFTEEYWP